MKLQEFINIIALYAESNDAIRRFHFDFSDNLGQISAEDTQFPLLYMELTSSTNLDNALSGYKGYEYGFNLFIVDRINQSRSNILPILNDTNLIAQDVKGYIQSINGMSINDGLFIEPMNNAYYDNLSGVMMRLTITMDGGDDCAVEYQSCTPLTIEFMNTIGDIIERRSMCVNDGDTEFVIVPNGKVNVSVNGDFKELVDVPSGATISYDVSVNDGEVILYNSLGEELQRSDISADEVKNLIAPDASVDVMCNGYNLITMSIPSNNNVVLNIPQSDWNEIDINNPSYIVNKPDLSIYATQLWVTSQISLIDIPTSTSQLLNDSGYITNSELSDYATVIYVDNAINGLNIPSSTSDLVNDSGYITLSDIPSVSFLTLTDTPSSYSGEGGKIVAVKNDGTGLEFISAGSGGNQVQSDWNESDNNEVSYIKNKPDLSVYASVSYVDGEINSLNIPTSTNQLVNNSGFITISALTGYATQTWVNTQIGLIDIPTTTNQLLNNSGFITSSALSPYYTKLEVDGIESGLESQIMSVNDDLTDLDNSLATVAKTGSYNDLSNKPSIPSEQVNSDWNAISGKAVILNKPDLSGYATVTYVDDEIDALDIPTNTNQLVNGSGFITSSALSPYSDTIQMNTAISDKVDKVNISTVTTNKTLSIANDYGRFLYLTTATTLTIPTHASEAFEIGTRIDGFAMSDTSIIVSSGVTITSDEGNTIVTMETGFSIIKINNNEWLLVGKLK